MTKEEAIKRLKQARSTIQPFLYVDEAIDYAINALEQEPCDDAISRQAVLDQTYLWSKDEFLRTTIPFDYLRKRINSLPSATPKSKTEVLNKIRAEIKAMFPPSGDWMYDEEREHEHIVCEVLSDVLQIIDKYKAGEDKE